MQIIRKEYIQQDVFARIIDVYTEDQYARRVWQGLAKRLSAEARDRIYYCFLSGLPGTEHLLLRFARHVFDSADRVEEDFSNPDVLEVSQLARKVWREKHRMEAFVRFRQLKDDLYYAGVEPDYNVLPLIASHFKSRYADQHWLIYDIRRKYGIYYSPASGYVSEVNFEWTERKDNDKNIESAFSEREELYQTLWKDYFKSTGIPARKNMQLHLKHVPKRYWKYLTEKHQ